MVMSTLFDYGFGATSVSSQAEVEPGPQPRRGPPKATGDSRPTCGARGRQSTATGRNSHDSLRIVHWNANGVKDRKLALQEFLKTNSVDVCCIQETHLKEGQRFSVRGYETIRHDRPVRKKGGILTLVSNTIAPSEIQRSTGDTEFLGVELVLPLGNLKVYNIYSPPDKKLELESIKCEKENWMIVGDFNSHSPSWGYSTLDSKGEDLEDWIIDKGLVLINRPDDPTTFTSMSWRTTSAPDIAIATDDIHKLCTRKVNTQLGGSDHKPIILDILKKYPPETDKASASWNIKKANWELFRQMTEEFTKKINLTDNVDKNAKDFNTAILNAALKSIPRGRRKNYQPFWSDELQKLHKDLDQAREKMDSDPSDENVIAHNRAKATFTRQKIVQQRESWHNKTSSLNYEKDCKKLWNLTRAVNEENLPQGRTAILEDGKLVTGKQAANALAKSYKEDSMTNITQERTKEVRQQTKELQKKISHIQAMEDEITMQELHSNIKKLKTKKAPGPDKIMNDMIKHLGPKARNVLLRIFNQSWEHGRVPNIWKEAHIVPIHKKGKDKKDTKSYRPISLLSCVGKLLEKIINKRLQGYLETHRILSDTQTGFRKNKNTEDQLTYFIQKIENGFQEGKKTLAVFFDMTKAFDTVWKDGLLLKLAKGGIAGKMYKWIKSFLENRTARVKLEGIYSNKINLKEGVPQGSTISPTLFLIFIDEIVSTPGNNVKNTLHADDFAIFSTCKYANSANLQIQETVTRVSDWVKKWGLKINKNKTFCTLFSLSNQAQKIEVKMDEQILPQTSTPTFLGVTLDKRLTWRPHIQSINSKASRKLLLMKKLAGTTWGANTKVLKQVYTGAVRPVMEYGSSAWAAASKSSTECLNVTQNQGMRTILAAQKSTPIAQLEKYSECAPLDSRRRMKSFIQYEKSKRITTHPLRAVLEERTKNRLKRKSPNHIAKEVASEHEDLINCIPEQLEDHSLNQPPNSHMNLEICKEIPGINNIGQQSAPILKAHTLDLIDMKYNNSTWTHVFTDGSATDAVKNGGSGVFIQHPSGDTNRISLPAGQTCSNYKAELVAIQAALDSLQDQATENIVLFTDSLSALQSLDSDRNDHTVLNIRKSLIKLCERHKVVLQWVPSHCGIPGNEEADRLAKLGSSSNDNQPSKLSYQEVKTLIRTKWNNIWRRNNGDYSMKQDPMHYLDRNQQKTILHLRTGHCCLKAHLHKQGKAENPHCSCGPVPQTPHHVLQECPLLGNIRDEIWPSSTSMVNKLWDSREALLKTVEFLKRAELQA